MFNKKRVLSLVLVMIFMSVFLTGFISSADFDPTGIKDNIESNAKDMDVSGEDGIYTFGGTLLYGVKLIGMVLAILLVIWYGIKWMTAGPQQRAALKEQAWNYIIGAALLFGSGHIAQWIYDIVVTGVGNS